MEGRVIHEKIFRERNFLQAKRWLQGMRERNQENPVFHMERTTRSKSSTALRQFPWCCLCIRDADSTAPSRCWDTKVRDIPGTQSSQEAAVNRIKKVTSLRKDRVTFVSFWLNLIEDQSKSV
jgi:transposase-like protein